VLTYGADPPNGNHHGTTSLEAVNEPRHHHVESDKHQHDVSPRETSARLYPRTKASKIAPEELDRALTLTNMNNDQAGKDQTKRDMSQNRQVHWKRDQRQKGEDNQPQMDEPTLMADFFVHSLSRTFDHDQFRKLVRGASQQRGG
jgi:hypothetical protein